MLARKVAGQLLKGEPEWAPRWELGQRLLDRNHFEFRGGPGEEPSRPDPHTRREDK